MAEVSKVVLKTYFEDGKEPDENKFVDLIDTLWEQGGGVSDHGALDGLADDDHPQYLLADGSRVCSGDFVFSQDVRIGGGLYVGGVGQDPIQGTIQAVNDIRAGGGLVVGSVSANPASGYAAIGKGLSVGDTAPPYEARGNLFLDYTGAGSYGFINSVGNLHLFQNMYYDGGWKAIGSGKTGGFQTSMGSDYPLYVSSSQASYTAGQTPSTFPNFSVSNSSVLRLYLSGTTTEAAQIYSDANWFRINPSGAQRIYTPTGIRADGGLSATSSVSPSTGIVFSQELRVYEGATLIGAFTAQDSSWFRINQYVAKNTYSPYSIVVAGGLMSGTSYIPGYGYTGYTVALRPYKNSTGYITYSYHAYATKKTSGSFDGDAKSTTGATKIDLSAVFGVPAGVKAVNIRIFARDSSGHILTAQYLGVGPSAADPFMVTVRPVGNDQIMENTGITTCDGNGDIYWRCGASGGGTLDIWIEISGYFI